MENTDQEMKKLYEKIEEKNKEIDHLTRELYIKNGLYRWNSEEYEPKLRKFKVSFNAHFCNVIIEAKTRDEIVDYIAKSHDYFHPEDQCFMDCEMSFSRIEAIAEEYQ